MNYPLIVVAIILGALISISSCKKAEEVKVETVKEVQESPQEQESLAKAMKKASRVMRRLSKAVEDNDWVDIDIWTQELKEGIGYYCVELYMIENNDISSEFISLSNKFVSSLNKLILSSKTHDTNNSGVEFNRLIKSCDGCHAIFFEKVGRQLDVDDLISTSLKKE